MEVGSHVDLSWDQTVTWLKFSKTVAWISFQAQSREEMRDWSNRLYKCSVSTHSWQVHHQLPRYILQHFIYFYFCIRPKERHPQLTNKWSELHINSLSSLTNTQQTCLWTARCFCAHSEAEVCAQCLYDLTICRPVAGVTERTALNVALSSSVQRASERQRVLTAKNKCNGYTWYYLVIVSR